MNDTSIIAWMEQIDRRLQSIENRLVSKTDHEKLENRVERVESKTNRLAIKIAGISSLLAFVGFVASQIL